MIRIQGTRFGDIQVEDHALIHFPQGLLGFPDEQDYVLLELGERGQLGYLQSMQNPNLAFPVMDGALFAPWYPIPNVSAISDAAGFGDHEVAMLLIVVGDPDGKHIETNMVAPVIIDLQDRVALQMTLDPNRYSSHFRLSAQSEPENSLTAPTPDRANTDRANTDRANTNPPAETAP